MKKLLNKAYLGFTLIELMIVVVIIGILASIAQPCGCDYMTKAKFSEIVINTKPIKTAVERCAQITNSLATCSNALNVAIPFVNATMQPNDFIETITVGAMGVITATAIGTAGKPSKGLAGQTYVLTPSFSKGKITWVASGTCKSAKLC